MHTAGPAGKKPRKIKHCLIVSLFGYSFTGAFRSCRLRRSDNADVQQFQVCLKFIFIKMIPDLQPRNV